VVVPVSRETSFGDTLEALGSARANESVRITANVTEFVREIRFEDGQTVRAGDVLVVLDKEEEEAALKAAQAQLDERNASFERARELVQQQAVSTATLQEREALLRQIEGTMEGIEALRRDRVIQAPFDGVLGLREVSLGTLVTPGDLITTLDDVSAIKVDFNAPSLFLPSLQPGLPLQARVDAYPDRVFTGTVTSIDSRIDPATRTVRVRALLPNEERLLRPGLLMKVTLIKNPRPALLIPEGTVVQRGTRSFVFTVADRDGIPTAVESEISIGARSPGWIEVTGGLIETDRVILHGLMQVRPGQALDIRGVSTGTEALTSFTGDTLRNNGEQ
jgi:membrane fusion protein (multidrug efflux system)